MSKRNPSFIDKVNYIVDFVDEPCHVPWFVYVETAIIPLGGLLFDLLTFGWGDVARGALRPKNVRSARHFRKGRRGSKAHGIPEVGNEIGSFLGRSLGLDKPLASQGVRYVWLFDEGVQRASFWWLVIDAAADFMFYWSSNLHRVAGCGPEVSDAHLWQQNDVTWSLATDQWIGMGIKDLTYGEPFPKWPVSFAGGAHGAFMVHGGTGVKPTRPDASGLQLGISIGGATPLEETLSDPGSPSEASPIDFISSGNIPPGRTGIAQWRHDKRGFVAETYFAFAMSNKYKK